MWPCTKSRRGVFLYTSRTVRLMPRYARIWPQCGEELVRLISDRYLYTGLALLFSTFESKILYRLEKLSFLTSRLILNVVMLFRPYAHRDRIVEWMSRVRALLTINVRVAFQSVFVPRRARLVPGSCTTGQPYSYRYTGRIIILLCRCKMHTYMADVGTFARRPRRQCELCFEFWAGTQGMCFVFSCIWQTPPKQNYDAEIGSEKLSRTV